MASARNNKSKSGGLRFLWIPGRKSHPKGRFETTNKQITHLGRQRKNEMWSLGGSRAQKDLLQADPDTALFEGPSVSGATAAACALGAVGAAKCSAPADTIEGKEIIGDAANSPTSPSSTASTALVVSLPNSPVPALTITPPASSMPTKTATAVAITTVTTAEIIDENRFSILGKDISNEVDVYALPSPPKNDLSTPPSARANALLNSSAGTTVSSATTPSPNSSHRIDTELEQEPAAMLAKRRINHKNNNNNHQNDINSIESISENTKIPSDDLEWIEDMLHDRNSKEFLKNKRKKKKKTKELDQLDGVANKHNASETPAEEDEKVVKCLYYTLMCCECTIS